MKNGAKQTGMTTMLKPKEKAANTQNLKGQINWREINKIRPHAVKVSN